MKNLERARKEIPVLNGAGNPTGKYVYNGNVANRPWNCLANSKGCSSSARDRRPGSFDMLDHEELDSRIKALAAEVIDLKQGTHDRAHQLLGEDATPPTRRRVRRASYARPEQPVRWGLG